MMKGMGTKLFRGGLLGVLVVGMCSCDRDPKPAPAQTGAEAPSRPSAPPSEPTAIPGTEKLPADPAAPTSPPAAADDQSAVAAHLDALTQALRKYSAEKQRVPKSLEELVAAGYLPALPRAPAGRKFTINPDRVEVILAK